MSIDEQTKDILTNLKSNDSDFALEVIEKIKISGNKTILSALLDFLHETTDPEIKKAILHLLGDLKDKDSIPVIISAIQNEKYTNEKRELVASCWQNGLIYNEYLPFFIDLVIHEEFPIAFEAFTVIENMYGIIQEEVLQKESLKIENAVNSANQQKSYLLKELLVIINAIPEISDFNQ